MNPNHRCQSKQLTTAYPFVHRRGNGVLLAAFALMAQLSPLQAEASPELMKAKNCATCHQVDTKFIGPAFKDVAAKYSGRKDAQAVLVNKVMKGGVGVWGQIPKPPATNLSKEEAQTLVKWVLTLK